MSKQSILFISTQLPYPPKSGGTIKSWNYIKDLSNRYDIGLACLLKDDDEQHLESFKSQLQLKDLICIPLQVDRNPITLVKSYLGFPCLNVFRNYSTEFQNQLTEKAEEYDAILIDHYEVFQYVPRNYKGKVILHTHNAEFALWKRMGELNTNPLVKIVLKLEASRVKRYEKRIIKHADLVYTTPSDIQEYKKAGFDTEDLKITYHLGNDQLLMLDNIEFNATEKALLFMGTLSWEPNIDGMLWFIREVYPKLLKKHPELTLYILGKLADERLQNACKDFPNIQLCGFVKDIDQYLQKSRVFLAPLRFGSGMKVKVLEGMYRGIPMVTTSVGAEGLDVSDQEELYIADDAKSFSEKTMLLLENKEAWEKTRDLSRKKAAQLYTWQPLFDKMDEELRKVLK